MADALDTCWTVVGRAALGDDAACTEFAHTYLAMVRSFLSGRWRSSPLSGHVEDAVQEVFLDLFRPGGALTRFDRNRGENFRKFLFGVVRNVALRHEERSARERGRRGAGGSVIDLDDVASPDAAMSRVFDREWALAIVKRARARYADAAEQGDAAAQQRAELLRLRFGEGLPIRAIADRWGEDAAKLHHDYARARDEFKQALRAEVAFHHNGTSVQIEQECRQLLQLLAR